MKIAHKSKKSIIPDIIYVVILTILVLYTIVPILWTLGSSLRTDEEIFRYAMPLSIHTFIPAKITGQAYVQLFRDYGFLRPLINTFFIAIATIVLGFVTNALAGFVFAKYNFPYKNLLFAFYLLSFMVPFEVIAIPLYKVVDNFGMLDSYSALIIPLVANGLIVFMFKQFFQDIPDSLIESAIIDGASTMRIFWQIIVPLSKPVIISASLIMFMQQWDAFLWPMIAATGKDMRVIQVALSLFKQEYTVFWNIIFAGSIVAISIPAILVIPLQKYYIQGVSNTGLKE